MDSKNLECYTAFAGNLAWQCLNAETTGTPYTLVTLWWFTKKAAPLLSGAGLQRFAELGLLSVLDGGLRGYRYCEEIAVMVSATTDNSADYLPYIRCTLYHLWTDKSRGVTCQTAFCDIFRR